jgi:hypothetical protein
MNELHEGKRPSEPRKVFGYPGGAGGDGLVEARQRLPLDKLMASYGLACPTGRKTDFVCPFCKKKKASLREHNGRLWFKCFNPGCSSGTYAPHSAFDEVRFIGFKLGLSHTNGRPGQYSDAAIAFMKEAGVWQER